MSYRDLIYWKKGFNFSRLTHGDRVAVETYRLLYHYTWENPNCRAGIFIEKFGESQKFYTIHQLIPNFDHFYNTAMYHNPNEKISKNDFIRDLSRLSFSDRVKEFQRLETYIRFEFESKSLFKTAFGYNFNRSLAIVFEPKDINQVEGESLDNFRIYVKNYIIQVTFRDNITIL